VGLASRLLLQALFTKSSHGELPLAPSLVCSRLLHVLFSSVFLSFFFFGKAVCQSVQGAVLAYPRGGCGNTTCHLFAYLLVCVSQEGLEPASGGLGVLLISQCNVAWRSFVWVGGLECQSFASSLWFFLPRVAPASQQDF
jgi:hypothetical protein